MNIQTATICMKNLKMDCTWLAQNSKNAEIEDGRPCKRQS